MILVISVGHVEHATLVDRPSKGLPVKPSLGLGVRDRRPVIRVGFLNIAILDVRII